MNKVRIKAPLKRNNGIHLLIKDWLIRRRLKERRIIVGKSLENILVFITYL